tara:strand:+ start:62 stop:256 length:195 start_codon:yes stop_codon:yes gene_type:complete
MTHQEKCIQQLKLVGKQTHDRLLNIGFTKKEASDYLLLIIEPFKEEINRGLTINAVMALDTLLR